MPTKTKKRLDVGTLYNKLHQADRTNQKLEVIDTNGISYRIDSAGRSYGTALSDSGVIVSLSDVVDYRLVSNRQDSLRMDSDSFTESVVFHCDSYPLKHYEIEPSTGFLRFIAPICRTGDLIYLDEQTGKPYPEYVPPETVVSSMDSFKGKPLTLLHPPVKVTNQNARQFSRGMTHNQAVFDGSWLWMNGTATDQELIQSIVSGKTKEISPGYDANIRKDGNRLIQVARVGNHIAAVPQGRNGRDIGFKVDSNSTVMSLRQDISDREWSQLTPPEQLLDHLRVNGKRVY